MRCDNAPNPAITESLEIAHGLRSCVPQRIARGVQEGIELRDPAAAGDQFARMDLKEDLRS